MSIEDIWPDGRSTGTARALNNIALARLVPGYKPADSQSLIIVDGHLLGRPDGKYSLLFRAASAQQGHWHRLLESTVENLKKAFTENQIAMLAMWRSQNDVKPLLYFWVIPLKIVEEMSNLLPSGDTSAQRNITIDPNTNRWYQNSNKDNYVDLSKYAGIWELTNEELNHISLMEQTSKQSVPKIQYPKIEPMQNKDEKPLYALNTIFYGPPGTGKTYSVYERAVRIIDFDHNITSHTAVMSRYRELRESGRIKFITFHQSYSYEEFVEGFRSKLTSNNQIEYVVFPGILREIVEKAKSNKTENYVLIIDEINRGNISKIFGELITLLDGDKRLGCENETDVTLTYSKDIFSLPPNLYILGTMNTADRSIALMDVALRRRFVFEEIMPDSEIIQEVLTTKGLAQNFIELVTTISEILNRRIEVLLDRDHQIGHSYFLDVCNKSSLKKIWYEKIIPLLQEYFYNDWNQLKLLLGTEFIQIISNKINDQQLFATDPIINFPGQIIIYEDEDKFIDALKKSFLNNA